MVARRTHGASKPCNVQCACGVGSSSSVVALTAVAMRPHPAPFKLKVSAAKFSLLTPILRIVLLHIDFSHFMLAMDMLHFCVEASKNAPGTSIGVRWSAVPPVPSWPSPFQPQHLMPPPLPMVHAWLSPKAMEVAESPARCVRAGKRL
jgi:hypothetical protein